jgi:tRNA modification GTPase
MLSDTIFALSSGSPPAAIAVLRISGPQAGAALTALAGKLPVARRATLASLRDAAGGGLLDTALILWFPGPATATGEDLAEIHAHGGRAVVRAIEAALSRQPGLRSAEPGEFTRRALTNGRIDLAEAEGLADLLSAETESQRKAAVMLAGGSLSREVADWQDRLLAISARVEALLDFADEEDAAADAATEAEIRLQIQILVSNWQSWLARPPVERLRDGLTVAIAGPPNAGKSTLLNALARREAAIVSPLAGTTRDIVEVPLALDGIPFRFADTAGLHAGTGDAIEAIGMDRARAFIAAADILLWLGAPDAVPNHPQAIRIAAQCDREDFDRAVAGHADLILSAGTGQGMDVLHHKLVATARTMLPGESETALNARHRAALADAADALTAISHDPLLIAEALRSARVAIDSITGAAGTESMLDALFGKFCIGK